MNLKKIFSDSFFKSISMLATGSVVGQIVGFIGSIITTRLFSQESIGIVTMLTSIIGIFSPVINGRFDFAIVKEQDEDNIPPLIDLSLIVGFIAGIFVASGSYFYFLNKSEVLSPIICALYVFLTLIIIALTNVFRSYNNHVNDYGTMTWVIVIRKVAEAISITITGFLKMSYFGLMISRFAGEFFGMKRQTRNITKNNLPILKSNKDSISRVFNIHKKQLFFSTPAALINTASYSILSLFIAELFGFGTLGIYSISYSVLGLPLSVISGNVSKVYFSEASREYSESGCFKNSTKKTLGILIGLAVIVWASMNWIIPFFVPKVYGESYIEAGEYIRILAPMFSIRFIVSSLITGFVVANKQQFEMVLEFGFILSAVVVFFYVKQLNLFINSFLIGISITYSIVYLLFLVFILLFARRKSKD